MTSVRVSLACVFVVLAVLTAVLAGDVRAWRSAFVSGDSAAHTTLGGVSETLLGVSDDLQLRHALRLYADASKLHLRLDNALTVESARARAQDALEQVSRAGDPQRVSQVLTLLGILAYRASASGGAQSQVDAAISDFTDAVRADPANGQAAYDLELLLRLTAARGSRVEPGQGGGFGRTGHRGAGGGQPGSGY
jgi:hypothetical protein